MEKKWWHNTIGYQIYPKSFQDTNGDGIGDIQGVIAHLSDLAELGINVIWLCPIYKSPMLDHGYDISDYDEIDPMFGDMKDMKELIAEANKCGIKVLMDLVVNHTSDQHPWFQEALKNPDSKYRDYYIFKKGKNGLPPNNWRSIFGGSAWESVGDSEDYYLHLFTKGQPDLNWENPELREAIYEMVSRWLEMGLGGFRVDAISHLKKDFSYINQPEDGPDGLANGFDYFRNAEGLNIFLEELKEKTFKRYGAFTIGEVDDVKSEELPLFIGVDGYFSTIFDFCHSTYHVNQQQWKDNPIAMVNEVRDKLFAKQEYVKGKGLLCNYTDNHDTSRSIERFIPKEHINFYSASLVGAVNFFLAGIVFLYQGQEIGMLDYPKKTIEEYLDLATYNNYLGYIQNGMTEEEALEEINITCREHARTPMQWNAGENAGFTTGVPWFAVNPNYRTINYESQKHDPNSLLTFYKKMIALRKRKDLEETFIYGDTVPCYLEKEAVIAYKRVYKENQVLILNNAKNHEEVIAIAEQVKEVLMGNYPEVMFVEEGLCLRPFEMVVLK